MADQQWSHGNIHPVQIDKEMKKSDLEREAHLTHYSLSKLTKGQDVSTEVLYKICSALDCEISDIMEFSEKVAKNN